MSSFAITKTMTATPDRVWAVIGNPGVSPGAGVSVSVARPGAADSTGLVRDVTVGRSTYREEITSVGPGRQLAYRMLAGAPVHHYVGRVAVADATGGGTSVRWDVRFEPKIPGSGPVVSFLSKRTLRKVLALVDERARAGDGTPTLERLERR